MKQKELILIAGPCAAESEQQVVDTAQSITTLAQEAQALPTPIRWIYRAGVWKPRTSPDTFQGAGEVALDWLQKAESCTGMPAATEVATPEHVRQALQAGIRTLWIGARTSANPIAVQELADAIRTTTTTTTTTAEGLTILVKNPVNEDVNLWLGDIERMEKALQGDSGESVGRVMAIHRGCGHKPCWAMAFELRRRRPDIPLLLDPSHMSGDARQIAGLCQQAMDLNYDGLMVEVHNHPAEALSDSKQQITPAQLMAIIEHLTLRESSEADTMLLALRKQIDELDDELWHLIRRRMQVSQQIGEHKRQQNMPVLQTKRYDEILRRRIQWGVEHGLSEESVQQIMEAIHKESVRVQL